MRVVSFGKPGCVVTTLDACEFRSRLEESTTVICVSVVLSSGMLEYLNPNTFMAPKEQSPASLQPWAFAKMDSNEKSTIAENWMSFRRVEFRDVIALFTIAGSVIIRKYEISGE